MTEEKIFVFHGEGARFAGAVFSCLGKASEWIEYHKLTGVLTAYPLNQGVYEWAIEKGYFDPKKEHHNTAEFIGGFTSASQEHYHYEEGERKYEST